MNVQNFELGQESADWEELIPTEATRSATEEDDDDSSLPSLECLEDAIEYGDQDQHNNGAADSDSDDDPYSHIDYDAFVNNARESSPHIVHHVPSDTLPLTSQDTKVWCHVCNSNTSAHTNTEEELECNVCQSTFVEQVDQGVESFLAPTTTTTGSNQHLQPQEGTATSELPSISDADRNAVVNQVLGRILGMSGLSQAALTSNRPITIVREGSDGIRRPVGLLIRQVNPLATTATRSIYSSSSLLSSSTSLGNRSGVLDLLTSLSNIRQGSPNFNNEDALSNAQFEQFLHHVLMNETSHAGAPAATDEMIEKLPTITLITNIEASSLGECSISQENFEVGDIVVCLPCDHKFKQEPILHWLKLHRTCPVCRIDITTPPSTETAM